MVIFHKAVTTQLLTFFSPVFFSQVTALPVFHSDHQVFVSSSAPEATNARFVKISFTPLPPSHPGLGAEGMATVVAGPPCVGTSLRLCLEDKWTPACGAAGGWRTCVFPSLCTYTSGQPAVVVLLEQGGWTRQPETFPNLHHSVVLWCLKG